MPTAVRVRGEVLNGPRVRSPFTDVESLVFGWSFFVSTTSLEPAGTFFLAEDLRLGVEDQVIAIPTQRLDIRFRSGAREAAPVDRVWPTFIPEPKAADRGAIYFVEYMLLEGDLVELTATVEPVLPAARAYRGALRGNVQFTARPDLEPIILDER